MNKPADVLQLASRAPSIAGKLRQIKERRWPVCFSHVTDSAQPFLVAALAREVTKTIWVTCPNVRTQELFFETLLNWVPNAQFLPEAEFAAVENVLPDPEIAAERLALLLRLEESDTNQLVIATRASLDQIAPQPGSLRAHSMTVRRGKSPGMGKVIEQFTSAGYLRVPQVTTRGQFAVRGGIVDLYSWQAQLPLRIEFFGDDIESLREFDVDTQTSVRETALAEILLSPAEEQTATARDYIGPGHLQIEIEPNDDSRTQIRISEGWIEDGPEDFAGAFEDCGVGEFAVGDFMLAEAKRAQFVARLNEWRGAKAKIVIYFQTEGEIERFKEIIAATDGALDGVELREGTLSRGFCFPEANLVVLSAAELFGRSAPHAVRRLQRAERISRHRAQIDFSELGEGDFVVHLEHGVGRFLGLVRLPSSTPTPTDLLGRPQAKPEPDAGQEVIALEFAEEARLYVPLEQAYMVSRYVGASKKSPPLSSLADARWARVKRNAAAAIFDYAGKMLALQAEREIQPGYAFGPDTKWQVEFEHSFPYRETPDQLKAIVDAKRDMERARSMDRLICGDVGFGKTEVAVRAA
ncbi:MAG TPA: CarD family transcriptional regulator, partial [Chthoniobacterales bacterium]